MKKRALILGITGQDGSYLADILLEKGYEVHGMYRRSSSCNLQRLAHIPQDKLYLHQGDMLDIGSVEDIITQVEPHEIYNEADQDDVGWSYKVPNLSYEITGAAVGRILEVIRHLNRRIKFFQPVSATMFGDASPPQNEETPFNPQSPYACAKVMAYYLSRYYRKVHGMFVSTGILYNHDSPRRGDGYLLQKIARAVVNISNGKQETLAIGSLDMIVDIGYAKDYMRAVHSLMQLDEPDDFIICSRSTCRNTCRIYNVCEAAFDHIGIVDWRSKIRTDPKFHQPGNPQSLTGDYRKLASLIGDYTDLDAEDMVEMLINEIRIKRGKLCV